VLFGRHSEWARIWITWAAIEGEVEIVVMAVAFSVTSWITYGVDCW